MNNYQLAIGRMEIRPGRWNKTQFFPSGDRVDTGVWMHYMDVNYITYEEKAWRQIYKNAASSIEQDLEAAPYKVTSVQPLTTHHENYPS